MNFLKFYDKINTKRDNLIPKIDFVANNLIVIFAFSVPILIQVRRISLFLILILFLFRGKYYTYFRSSLRDPLVLAFTLYFIVHVIWLFGTNDYTHASKRVHDASFLLFPLLFSSFIDKRYISRIFYAFLLGMAFSIIVSFGLYFELIPPQPFDGSGQGTSANPTPIYNHAMYGFMLAITSALSLQRIYFEKIIYLKVVFTILFIASSINVFIILSRLGYIIYLVIIVFTLAFIFRKRVAIFVLASTLITTITFILASNFSANFNNRIQYALNSIQSIYKADDYSSSIGERYAIYSSSIMLIQNNHLLGLGTGDDIEATKRALHDKYPEIDEKTQSLQHLHNEFLSAFLQFGWIGLLLFLNIIYQMFRYNNIAIEKRNATKILGIAILLLSTTEIFVIGLGALLTTVTLSSLILNNYSNTAKFSPINYKTVFNYILAIILFHGYSILTG